MIPEIALIVGFYAPLILLADIFIKRRSNRKSHLHLLRKYNVIMVKYGIESKQAIKFYNKHSNKNIFVCKADLMKKTEKIKRNIMFSPSVEKKLKNKVN